QNSLSCFSNSALPTTDAEKASSLSCGSCTVSSSALRPSLVSLSETVTASFENETVSHFTALLSDCLRIQPSSSTRRGGGPLLAKRAAIESGTAPGSFSGAFEALSGRSEPHMAHARCCSTLAKVHIEHDHLLIAGQEKPQKDRFVQMV